MPRLTELPLEELLRLQRQSLGKGRIIPAAEELDSRIGGLGFAVGDLYLVCELNSVSDIVDCGALTMVPRSKAWMRGITNVRGRLCSICDLGMFLGIAPPVPEAEGKLLVLSDPDLGAALLVPRVFGLRYFDEETEQQGAEKLDEKLRSLAKAAYLQGGHLWGVLDVERLTELPRFRTVADGM